MVESKSLIMCGSKRYDNINFDNIVDSFDMILRCNMNINNSGYGTRESDIQILNAHLIHNYKSVEKLRTIYTRFTDKDTIEKFINYISVANPKYLNYRRNNTDVIKQFIKKLNINFKMNLVGMQELRAGFAYIPDAYTKGYDTYVIGFSLTRDEYTSHQVNFGEEKLEINDEIHDRNVEIGLLKALHENNILDATLCAITDEEDITIDCSLIAPKLDTLLYITQIHENVWLKNYKNFTKILDENNITWEEDKDKIKISI